jgi:uncharacterized protein YkwD
VSALDPSPAGATVHARTKSCPNAGVQVTRLSRRDTRAAVLCLTNRERAKHGLPRLRESRRLETAAQRWTDAMVATDYFSHGGGPAAHVSAAGLTWSAVGENIATGYPTPLAVVAGWMANAPHCEIILSPVYTDVGTGVDRQPVGGYASGPATWVEDFALPAGHRAPSLNWGPARSCH